MTKQKQTPTKSKSSREPAIDEPDSTFFLKLILVLLLGLLWLRFNEPLIIGSAVLTAVPIGLLLGLFLIHRFEHFQIDRKIWFAVLVIATMISYFLPAGIIL